MFNAAGKYIGQEPDWIVWYRANIEEIDRNRWWSEGDREKELGKRCSLVPAETMKAWEDQDKQLQAEVNKYNAEERKQFEEAKKNLIAAMKKASGSWVTHSYKNQIKYVEEKIGYKSKPYPYRFDALKVTADKYKAVLAKEQDELKKSSKVSAAVKYCIEAGLKIEEDFTLQNAIATANETAREKAIEEASSNGEVDHSCCNECSSWDPNEPRCSCGNRRMYWEDDGDFTNMTVYPCAN